LGVFGRLAAYFWVFLPPASKSIIFWSFLAGFFAFLVASSAILVAFFTKNRRKRDQNRQKPAKKRQKITVFDPQGAESWIPHGKSR